MNLCFNCLCDDIPDSDKCAQFERDTIRVAMQDVGETVYPEELAKRHHEYAEAKQFYGQY